MNLPFVPDDLLAPGDNDSSLVLDESASSLAPRSKVFGGVAGRIADGLGLDPLWVRMAFVLLALAGGTGLVLYAGLWLLLIVGDSRPGLRLLGGLVSMSVLPLALNSSWPQFSSGPLVVVLLLLGLAVALWQPRNLQAEGTAAASVAANQPVARRARPGREPSLLGRATLGLATVIAAVGALIDQANGGRSHPEQWLGAAAVICGVGLLVAGFRGRGRWLVLPAVCFAATGYTWGVGAKLGVEAGHLAGDRWVEVARDSTIGNLSSRVGVGRITVDVTGVPTGSAVVDARVAFGEIQVNVVDDVTVEVHSRFESGEMHVDGARVAERVVTIGDGSPDVIVNAWVGRGDIKIVRSSLPTVIPLPAVLPTLVPQIGLGALTPVADFVGATSSGVIVLADGAAMIDERNQVVGANTLTDEQGNAVIDTPYGQFRLLPRGLLVTPSGAVLDLDAVRAQLGSSDGAAASTTTEGR